MRTIATIGLCTAAAAAAGPSLVGLWHESGSIVCDLLAVNPFTGSNVTIASNVSACGDVTQTYPAFSALNTDTGLIEVAISTAPSIFAYDPVTGAESTVAALPVYNNSDPYFGLVHVAGTSYLVTQYNLYAISGGALQQVMSVSLPGGTVVAAAEAVGTNPARIFAADEDGTTVAVITLGANAAVTSFTSGVSRPWDVQYRPGGSNDLIVLASYKLYAVDSTTVRLCMMHALTSGTELAPACSALPFYSSTTTAV